jgi:formylglycine-generating enzyme required for sulfatase activity
MTKFKVFRLIDQLGNPDTRPERRLQIGDELNDMEDGDPRFGVGLNADGLPEIDWVPIPGGSFIYGEDEAQTKMKLSAFDMARYPVTNAQFQGFVDDGGYEDERWWRGFEKTGFEASDWLQGNRPKININWYEATAFTRWLSYRLDRSIILPHETQWERAARGDSGLVYPWGNEYRSGFANVNETENKDGPHYLEQTTAVGIYPHAESPEGVLDLAGNVWEWCLNDYDKPTENFDVPHMSVLRGGAWPNFPRDARADYRLGDYPVDRTFNFGFRLLRSPPS